MKRNIVIALVALLTVAATGVNAAEKRTVCVFDIIGTAGDQYNIMTDYKSAAVNQGYDIELKVYTDERIAAEDLSSGVCDASAITGIRGRAFNKFTGSIDSIGAIPNYKAMRLVTKALASGNDKIVENMRTDTYSVMGVAPMGAAFLFVKNKEVDTVGELAGKSIAVMEYDQAQAKMASRVGMSPVLSDITNFAGRFNNNSVDICFAPVAAYSALELYRGMQPNGGIIEYVLGQLSMQLIARRDLFSPEFAAWSREWFATTGYDRAMRVINSAREEIDDKWWIEISDADTKRYNEMMREARVEMTGNGVYDKDMMTLLRNIRCNIDAGRAECSDKQEVYN
jgi:hypothetical protein